jgi:hypothetical protein
MAAHLKEYLFTSGSLVAREQADGGAGAAVGGAGSLGIGSLKGEQGL